MALGNGRSWPSIFELRWWESRIKSEQPFSILIADDEAASRSIARAYLSSSGFDVSETVIGEATIRAVREYAYDAVVLGEQLSGAPGAELCQRIRKVAPRTGIVMLSFRDEEEDKVRALEMGADDYIIKPFRFRELVARLHAVLRRTRLGFSDETSSLCVGNLRLDVERRTLWKGNEEIHLSPKEFDLLAYMFKHPGAPLTRTSLLRAVWGPEYGGELEYLRTYMRMLRKKIEDDPARPEYILTEPWVGYRFRNPTEAWPEHSKPQ